METIASERQTKQRKKATATKNMEAHIVSIYIENKLF